jgi:hypothetical protein
MEKEFIPYEQALELKELGFDEQCLACYLADTLFTSNDIIYNSTDIPIIKAPLYQQVFRWFREKYNLIGGVYHVRGIKLESSNFDTYVIGEFNTPFKEWSLEYQIYEEAELTLLKKLIEILKNK